MIRLSSAVAITLVMWFAGASAVQAYAGDKKSQYDEPVSSLSFVVLKDDNGKPVRNAGVVMHSVGKNGKQDRGGLELKTDAEGKASFDGVPYGKLRIQVLAQGFQTYGEDYVVNQPRMEITIKLKRPDSQYSIYEDQQNDKKPTTPPDPNAKPQK
jgi:Carboxypeptidase regulatory-like domain